MPMGGPGDYPLTDVLSHEIPSGLGEYIDDLIREADKLGGRGDLEMLDFLTSARDDLTKTLEAIVARLKKRP
jgi:hypothetical protein